MSKTRILFFIYLFFCWSKYPLFVNTHSRSPRVDWYLGALAGAQGERGGARSPSPSLSSSLLTPRPRGSSACASELQWLSVSACACGLCSEPPLGSVGTNRDYGWRNLWICKFRNLHNSAKDMQSTWTPVTCSFTSWCSQFKHSPRCSWYGTLVLCYSILVIHAIVIPLRCQNIKMLSREVPF